MLMVFSGFALGSSAAVAMPEPAVNQRQKSKHDNFIDWDIHISVRNSAGDSVVFARVCLEGLLRAYSGAGLRARIVRLPRSLMNTAHMGRLLSQSKEGVHAASPIRVGRRGCPIPQRSFP